MPGDRLLSQEEIDSVFRSLKEKSRVEEPARKAVPYDFRRPDRIAKHQLRAIHLLHENFARNLASSLSAYLRAYVIVNLVSVEQLSFAEFSQCLPSPSCLVSLAMRPYDGNAVLEINPSLVFPILEMLLGGSGRSGAKINREVTEIEQSILDGLYRIILHDLKQAWAPVTTIDFTIEARETEPQLLQIMSPNEAVLAIGLEVRMAENTGMMNIAMPSIIVKMLRQKFDQQWSVRRAESTAEEQARILRLIKPASIQLDARLRGPTLPARDLLELEPGDVLELDYPLDRPLDILINGVAKFRGSIGTTGRKRAFLIREAIQVRD
ncbi:MAG: flagellar motor switch protein FliM [Bryobacterales bacterium]|nr:flagellar motor switch protein FliM [Bryobacteraceae bacterium]MDW8130494.1 flagellar motor switch protein FliM [Bryobacterales bacterium]